METNPLWPQQMKAYKHKANFSWELFVKEGEYDSFKTSISAGKLLHSLKAIVFQTHFSYILFSNV